MWSAAASLLVGLIWGSTNPLIKRGSLQVEKYQQQHPNAGLRAWLRLSLILPWLVNQSGSALFVLLLANAADISRAVPIANAVSIAANAVADLALGEQYRLRYLIPGCCLVGVGVLLCL
jgi:hypothetical protein